MEFFGAAMGDVSFRGSSWCGRERGKSAVMGEDLDRVQMSPSDVKISAS